MENNVFQERKYRYTSKNSQYLDLIHKDLAKQVFLQKKQIEKKPSLELNIFDTSRQLYLFGRKEIIKYLPYPYHARFSLLEVACKTGYNLRNINKQYPNAHLTGLEESKKLLILAKHKLANSSSNVQLINDSYEEDTKSLLFRRPNVMLFSYALTQNPQWKEMILQAKEDLTSIGYIMVVDFYDSRNKWLNNFTESQHLQKDADILSFLQENFEPIYESVRPAYGGLWKYFSFIGKLVD